jgi:hypothetical protein
MRCTYETQLATTACICHNAGSMLHCSFSFLISFGVEGKTEQVAKAIRSSLNFSSYAALRYMHQRIVLRFDNMRLVLPYKNFEFIAYKSKIK